MAKKRRRGPRHRYRKTAPDPIPMEKRRASCRQWIADNTNIDPTTLISDKVLADVLVAKHPIGTDCPHSQVIHTVSGSLLASRFRGDQPDQDSQAAQEITSVYVIGTDCGKFIKIGKTKRPSRRFMALQTANPNPLVVYKVFSGVTADYEASLHDRFAKRRISGEWFEVKEDLLRWVIEMGQPTPVKDW